MFVISDKPTYLFRVEVKRPNDAGAWETLEFTGEFKRRSRPEIEVMIKSGLGLDAEIIETEFIGWKGVKQPDGSDLEVSAANRAVLLAQPFVQASVVRAWLESAILGPQKNS